MKLVLERALGETDAVMAQFHQLVDGVTQEQLVKAPAGGGWSAGQCMDHLTVTAWTMNELIDQAIGEARSRNLMSADDYQPNMLWRWFLKQIDAPPPGKKARPFKTPSNFDPAPRQASDVIQDFFASHGAFRTKFAAADPVDLKRIKVQSPFAKRMKYPLGLVFLIIPAHCRRHLLQARRVLG